ncbi:unnamed protein product [Brachionus calyciflorus]|uniref:Uncharacterized protein n=1 Tax=Brachionus calyciflorus TaxID=104777 RepID=A0A814KTF4_9BILA|nr:unnamed protein product [Brachionus calyciflorus]
MSHRVKLSSKIIESDETEYKISFPKKKQKYDYARKNNEDFNSIPIFDRNEQMDIDQISFNPNEFESHNPKKNKFIFPEKIDWKFNEKNIFKAENTENLIELPPIIRDSNLNKIIAGVWYGTKDPSSNFLFENLFVEIDELSKKGIKIYTGEKEVRVLINIYGFLADAPAKALCLNIKGPTGYFYCRFCLIKELRIDEKFKSDAEMAVLNCESVNGIKGFNLVVKNLKLPESCLMDYLHIVLEGVSKQY